MDEEWTLKDVCTAISDLEGNLNPDNFFGQTVGDELHQIEYQLSRIADSLEKIANK